MSSSPLSSLPRVDKVAAHPSLDPLRKRLGNDALTRLTRRVIEAARAAVKEGAPSPSIEEAAAEVARAARAVLAKRARSVINATGVVLHTNLGRAPLSRSAAEAVAASAGRYTSIEIDLETGRRGARGAFAESALSELSGSEAALVVNNNAAAVLLALSALTAGRRVVVSRGELVEIGGGFRIPEVLARSGAHMIEVGTTNKTRIDDYARALGEGDAILRVHQANFRQTGFVERPPLAALADLARSKNGLLIKDLGGGAMLDLAPYGLSGEPTVQASVRAGSDVVCFSTDKVLGGPQGGAIVGRAALVERCRRDPLARALRLGRLPLVALEATLASYLEGDLDAIPALAAVRAPMAEVKGRAEALRQALAERGVASEVIDLAGAMGGGSLAEEVLRSAGVAIPEAGASEGASVASGASGASGASVEVLAHRLRTGDPAVLGRIYEGRLLLDMRTVLPGEEAALAQAVALAVRGPSGA
jgi:L-seryl-tRNA(Ser) seleniumtransferase